MNDLRMSFSQIRKSTQTALQIAFINWYKMTPTLVCDQCTKALHMYTVKASGLVVTIHANLLGLR